ncbi:butyrophilin subfamily 1 member A1-like [Acipenser oxyrinchus oxyrinchus]|uniref:Butyrophilin subfamily 1 member A1-like n=1 Tax=Acipenser oxyrinchus oxyrinchus TaxID=40147 RepID=A0AAD8D6A7_ACIOX|nr:butyrophilin subfamily 1 member A1-like [Acipenser oxyrinchus oxyrinchus]
MMSLFRLCLVFLLYGAVESGLRCVRDLQEKPYSDVTFSCRLEGVSPKDVVAVTWKKGNDVVAQALPGVKRGKRGVSGDPRAEVREDRLDKGDMSLLLKDVQYTDQGSYHCTVATHSRKYDETVNLFIPEPEYPTVYFDSVTSTFTCNSSGWYREPKVQWTNEKGENLTDQGDRKSNTQLPHKWEDGALSLLSELPCHEVEKSECKPST